MKYRNLALIIVLALSVGSVTLISRSDAATPPVPNLMGVRAEYVELDTNSYDIYTTVHLVNTSFNDSITIESVSVHGPGGRNDTIGVHTAIQGAVIEPLGELRVSVDDSIPGVTPQGTIAGYGVRNVIIRWSGPSDALKVTSVMEQFHEGDASDRGLRVEEAYEVTL